MVFLSRSGDEAVHQCKIEFTFRGFNQFPRNRRQYRVEVHAASPGQIGFM